LEIKNRTQKQTTNLFKSLEEFSLKMDNVIIRELQKEDLLKGFLTTLDSLRQASNIEKNKADKIFDKIENNPDHIIVVALVDEKIVGAATLLFFVVSITP